MKIHTLFIHHLEETWADGLTNFGKSLDQVASNIIDYLHSPRGAHINEVILTQWEDVNKGDIPPVLLSYLDNCGIPYVIQQFGYGETREMHEGREGTLIRANRYPDDDDQVILIEDWHQDLKTRASVTLCGAFHGECVQDAIDVLTHVRGKKFVVLEDLVVGTFKEYEPHYEDAESAISRVNGIVQSIETDLEDDEDEDRALDLLNTELESLKADQGALLAMTYFQSEDNGYVYSENDIIEDALQEFIRDIKLSRQPKPRELSPSLSM